MSYDQGTNNSYWNSEREWTFSNLFSKASIHCSRHMHTGTYVDPVCKFWILGFNLNSVRLDSVGCWKNNTPWPDRVYSRI